MSSLTTAIQAGGVVIAQDAATSEVYGIPQSAAKTGAVDFVLPLDEIAATLLVLLARGHP
jgi:two-component system, chemotaxis family, protein-glutamate methylesterase/glutaminase